MAKVLREMIKINEALCDGCGDCITSCAEGALVIVNGKAKLKGEILCDGAGACLGHCPTGALTIEVRETDAYDEAAVAANLQGMKVTPVSAGVTPVSTGVTPVATGDPTGTQIPLVTPGGGCPGSAMRNWGNQPSVDETNGSDTSTTQPSQLRQWPVQLMLLQPNAPYFQNADLLIAADCVPFAFSNFHGRFLKGKALVVGCPKLDDLQLYFEKMTQIFATNQLKSVEVLKMEVPCCGGIADAAVAARKEAGVEVPLTITTISVQGELLDQQQL